MAKVLVVAIVSAIHEFDEDDVSKECQKDLLEAPKDYIEEDLASFYEIAEVNAVVAYKINS